MISGWGNFKNYNSKEFNPKNLTELKNLLKILNIKTLLAEVMVEVMEIAH